MVAVMACKNDNPTGSDAAFVMLLQCTGEAAQTVALCNSVQDALRDAAPKYAVQSVSNDLRTDLSVDDIVVRLVIEQITDHKLDGHLEWKTGPDAKVETGPTVKMDVMDAILSPSMYAGFANGLIKVTPKFWKK